MTFWRINFIHPLWPELPLCWDPVPRAGCARLLWGQPRAGSQPLMHPLIELESRKPCPLIDLTDQGKSQALFFISNNFLNCGNVHRGHLWRLSDKESTCNAEGLGRSPGGGHGNPLQYSCLGNPMDRRAWWAMVHRVRKSRTWLSNWTMTTYTEHKMYLHVAKFTCSAPWHQVHWCPHGLPSPGLTSGLPKGFSPTLPSPTSVPLLPSHTGLHSSRWWSLSAETPCWGMKPALRLPTWHRLLRGPTLTAPGAPCRLRLDLPAWKPQDLPLGQPRIHPFSLQASPCQEMLQKKVTIPHLPGQPGGPGQVAKPQGAHTPFYKIGPISNCQGGCEDWRRAVSRAWQQESSVRCQHSPSMGWCQLLLLTTPGPSVSTTLLLVLTSSSHHTPIHLLLTLCHRLESRKFVLSHHAVERERLALCCLNAKEPLFLTSSFGWVWQKKMPA